MFNLLHRKYSLVNTVIIFILKVVSMLLLLFIALMINVQDNYY